MAAVDGQENRRGPQVAVGFASVIVGLWLAIAIGHEAGAGNTIWILIVLATVAGLALAWLDEWVERRRSPRAIAMPAALLLATVGIALAKSLSDDNKMWIGLGAYGVGISLIALAAYHVEFSASAGGSTKE